MSASSYDELLKQVESLKVENGQLRRELQDNSSHLTKLEGEASNMKDVLTHLQTSMADEADGNYTLNLTYEQGEAPTTSDAVTMSRSIDHLELDQNSNASFTGSTNSFEGRKWFDITIMVPCGHQECVLLIWN